jgi:plasmid stabilization system protein ParE
VIYRIRFEPPAQRDLLAMHSYIADRSSIEQASTYVDRLLQWCEGFERFPMRGTRRDDIRRGLRITGFERRITIAFTVNEKEVVILRILYGGRKLDLL